MSLCKEKVKMMNFRKICSLLTVNRQSTGQSQMFKESKVITVLGCSAPTRSF